MAGGRELEARVAELEKQLGWALARIAKLEAENEQLRSQKPEVEVPRTRCGRLVEGDT